MPKKRNAPSKKPQDRKSGANPLVVVTTEHKKTTNPTEARAFLAALAKAPAGVRLLQKLHSEDGSKGVYVWEAPSLSVITRYLKDHFQGAHFGGPIGFSDPTPLITQVYTFVSLITAGGDVMIGGVRFGTYKQNKSKILLVGSIVEGQSGAFPPSGGLVGGFPALELEGLQWGDTFAAGSIPKVTAVLDQPASLQIVTAAGKSSNLWPVQFRAARNLVPVLIPGSAFNITACPGGGCSSVDGGTVSGFHYSNALLLGSGSGTDKYTCQLLNGFVYAGYEWTIQDGVNGGPFGANPDPIGQSEINLEVSWFYDFFNSSLYSLSVYAVGPTGLTGW
jgi:hypothetical protein